MRVSERILRLPAKLRERVEVELEQRADVASAAILSTTQRVLGGKRSGRRYRRGSSRRWYKASAPKESPAKRTGQLQASWRESPSRGKSYEGGLTVTRPGVTTDMDWLAKLMTKGAVRKRGGLLVRRPFKRKVQRRARRTIRRIYRQPYLQE